MCRQPKPANSQRTGPGPIHSTIAAGPGKVERLNEPNRPDRVSSHFLTEPIGFPNCAGSLPLKLCPLYSTPGHSGGDAPARAGGRGPPQGVVSHATPLMVGSKAACMVGGCPQRPLNLIGPAWPGELPYTPKCSGAPFWMPLPCTMRQDPASGWLPCVLQLTPW